MQKLFFVNNWENLNGAWSGTPKGLYQALSKKTTLKKLDVFGKFNKNKKFKKCATVFEILTMGLLNVKKINRKINKQDNHDKNPFFVFGEYSSKFVNNTYCYQDLSVDYVSRLREQHSPEARYAVKSIIPTLFIEIKKKIANDFHQDCAGIFTMSEWLKRDLIENSGISENKVHCVGGGCSVDINKINYSNKTGNKFLFVGKAWDRKNGDLVVEAFNKVCNLHPEINLKLYIAGPKKKPECIVNNENIVYLGRLTHDELVEYYNICDYFVMPSKFEAYGLVFAEALCFGLPCIGKNICAMPEFIENGLNGYLIEQDDSDELAELMFELFCNGQDMAKFVQANKYYYVEKYSWDSVADRIIAVIRQDGFDI